MTKHGVHSKDQTAFRFPPDLKTRLAEAAERHGQTMTEIVVRGTAAEIDRLDGITTAPGGDTRPARRAPAIAAEVEQPPQAGKNCKHKGMKLSKGVCPECSQWVTK